MAHMLLLKLIFTSLLSINHIFLPNFGSTSFLISPKSHFTSQEEFGSYHKVRYIEGASEALPRIDVPDAEYVRKNLFAFKEDGDEHHLYDILGALMILAQTNEKGYQELKALLERICLTSRKLLPFSGTVILYGSPKNNPGYYIEFVIWGARGISISKVSGNIPEGSLRRLGKYVRLSTIESASEVIGRLSDEDWDAMDEIIRYEGSYLLDTLFREGPKSCFMATVRHVKERGIKGIDKEWIGKLPIKDAQLRSELQAIFPSLFSFLTVMHETESDGRLGSAQDLEDWRRFGALANGYGDAALGALGKGNQPLAERLLEIANGYMYEAGKASVVNWLKEEVRRNGLRLAIRGGELIPVGSALERRVNIRELFGDEAADNAARTGVKELVFKRGMDSDAEIREVISAALDELLLTPPEAPPVSP